MPSRLIAAKELAEIFKALGHADRVRLIEELRGGERDVATLAEALHLPATRVSQHLALLRSMRLVDQRHAGRRHFYRLEQPDLARWIVAGLDFVEARAAVAPLASVEAARRIWSEDEPAGSSGRTNTN